MTRDPLNPKKELAFEGDPLTEPIGSVEASEYRIAWSTQNYRLRYHATIFDPSKRWNYRHLAICDDFDVAVKVCEDHARRMAA